MTTSLLKEIEKRGSKSLESDLKKSFSDKNKIAEYPKTLWFKGSRNR
tara:strand:+ start:251 stop:391 length:141 start_codon:yes stop_codon:yes gene_type:complete